MVHRVRAQKVGGCTCVPQVVGSITSIIIEIIFATVMVIIVAIVLLFSSFSSSCFNFFIVDVTFVFTSGRVRAVSRNTLFSGGDGMGIDIFILLVGSITDTNRLVSPLT